LRLAEKCPAKPSPGDFQDWSVDALQAALTPLWGPAYQSVAAAGLFDEERGGDYRSEAIGQGSAVE